MGKKKNRLTAIQRRDHLTSLFGYWSQKNIQLPDTTTHTIEKMRAPHKINHPAPHARRKMRAPHKFAYPAPHARKKNCAHHPKSSTLHPPPAFLVPHVNPTTAHHRHSEENACTT
jgi:hypothetical protein